MIQQTNTFTCDFCHHVESLTDEVDIYSDPDVTYPPGWGGKKVPEELLAHPIFTVPDACPNCMKLGNLSLWSDVPPPPPASSDPSEIVRL